MDWLQIIFLALVQGVTEFLPISSSAHLILVAELGAWADQGLAFDVAVHLGTLLGVVHLAFIVNETGNDHHSMRRRCVEAGAMIEDLDEFGSGELMVRTKAWFDRLL